MSIWKRIPEIDDHWNQFPLSLDACLREAASAKAGEGAGGRVPDHFLSPSRSSPSTRGGGRTNYRIALDHKLGYWQSYFSLERIRS
jgi:hypothetical protein